MSYLRLTLVLLLALGLTACGSSDEEEGGDRRSRGSAPTPSVEVVQTQLGSLPLEQRLSGTVRARNQVSIYPEITARVEEVLAESGDFVERGQPLVRLRDRTYREQVRQAEANVNIQRAQVRQARAQLSELQSELNRIEQLADREFSSRQELETLQAQVEGAEADVAAAEAQVEQAESTLSERRDDLAQTVIRSPVTGRIGRRDVEMGQRVDGSSRLFDVGDLSFVRVRVSLTDEMLSRIREGQTAQITSEMLPDTTITAQVSRISPFLDENSFSTDAEIDIPNEGNLLRPGMFVNVAVLYGESEQATLIPNSALYEDPGTGAVGVFLASSLGTEVEPDEPRDGFPTELTEPTPVSFREVDVIAEGRSTTGIRGIGQNAWVVALGHDLLNMNLDESVDARTRALSWERVLGLQELEERDMLIEFMERQQRMAEAERAAQDSSSTSSDSSDA
ncbi:MAG: efflux RND transporter periplasmic adaptor subunit [Bacteroidetes bacterium]|nr:efflux RND transporter periplasmic adaptor subunit [Bacteroidota bacterium]